MSTPRIRFTGDVALSASGAAAGPDAAESYRPDIIPLDITIPGIDRSDASRRIKTNLHPLDSSIIFLSAKVQETPRRQTSAADG